MKLAYGNSVGWFALTDKVSMMGALTSIAKK